MLTIKNHSLYINDVSFSSLAQRYGTPLYIYDQNAIEKRIQEYKTSFCSSLFKTNIVYASKAFLCTSMAKLINQFGLGMDVVSGGELYIAKQAGFDMDKIYFHGNNKTRDELNQAIHYKVKTIIVDNVDEIRLLAALIQDRDHTMDVLLRINPGIEAHTHKYIVTAHVDSKFGVLKSDIASIKEVIAIANASKKLCFKGFHAHIGSQIFDLNAFKAEIETMGAFIHDIQQETGATFTTLDLGGGFAAYYTEEDAPIPIPEVCSCILKTCEEIKAKYALSLDKILIEPGRSMVAEAGYSLYRVGFMKETPNKSYAFVDGGMSDNIRPALYGAKYRADAVDKIEKAKEKNYCIAGKCCESGDLLIEEAPLPLLEENDLLLLYTTGAYGYSMASNYNLLCIPAVVFVKDGQSTLVVRRQTYADLSVKDTGELL